MTIEEAHQFLDLPENPDKNLVTIRFREKYNFFKMLHTNAPNSVIRNLQEKNLERLEEIKKVIPFVILDESAQQENKNNQFGFVDNKIAKKNKTNLSYDNTEPLAYLVVHTENKQTKSFPLLEGDTIIGRVEMIGENCIVIKDDEFVSRVHCFININYSKEGLITQIVDNGRFNNSKPSLNGTYYNGNPKRIKFQNLKNGDTVQIGMTKLVYKLNIACIKNLEDEVVNSHFTKTIVINI